MLHTSRIRLHFLILLALLAFAPSSRAQIGTQRNDWAVGVNAGVGLNQVSFTPGIRQDYRTGTIAGFTARYTSERYYGMICALQVEANFWQGGWKENIYSAAGEKLADTYERHVDYIQVPILAHLGLGREDRGVKGFLLAGPQLSYAVADREKRSATWTTTTTDGIETPDRANNITAQYGKSLDHRFDYGITAGLGIEWATGAGRFIFDARYYYGLSDLFGNAKKDPFSRSANGTIIGKITYLINIRPKKH